VGAGAPRPLEQLAYADLLRCDWGLLRDTYLIRPQRTTTCCTLTCTRVHQPTTSAGGGHIRAAESAIKRVGKAEQCEWCVSPLKTFSGSEKKGRHRTSGNSPRPNGRFRDRPPTNVPTTCTLRGFGVEFLGPPRAGVRRFALACSAKDVLDGVALSGAGIVGISRSCAA